MILSAPGALLFSLKVINYALAGNHKFKPQQGHKRRNGIVFTPNTVFACLCVCLCVVHMCVLMLQKRRMVCVGGILLLSCMHCFVPLFYHLGLVLIQAVKALHWESTVCFSGQRETMQQHVRTQPLGTRWGPDVWFAQWEGEEGGGSGECSAHRQPASESESWWLISFPSRSPSRLLNATVCAPFRPHQHLFLGLRGEIISWRSWNRLVLNYMLVIFSRLDMSEAGKWWSSRGWGLVCSEMKCAVNLCNVSVSAPGRHM